MNPYRFGSAAFLVLVAWPAVAPAQATQPSYACGPGPWATALPHQPCSLVRGTAPTRDTGISDGQRQSFRPIWQITAWGGWARAEGFRDPDGIGVRPRRIDVRLDLAEVAVWLRPDLRLWVQFDGSPTASERALAEDGTGQGTFYGGGLVEWGPGLTTRIEGGWRQLPGRIGQISVRGQQTVRIAGDLVVSGWGWVGPREDDRVEWSTGGGIATPVGSRFHVSSSYHQTRSRTPDFHDRRVILFVELVSQSGARFGTGGGAGQEQPFDQAGSRGVWEAFVLGAIPLPGRRGYIQVSARRDDGSFWGSYTSASIGLTVTVR